MGLGRAAARGPHERRYEQFDETFHTRLRAFFHALAQHEPDRCVLIDAAAPPDEVAAQIWTIVSARFGL